MEEDEGTEEQERFSHRQRLKAAVHYTVGCLCEDVASDKEVQFSKQTIAAISELTFRQCEHFAKDLEMFARHAKRSTINTEDVKLLARRSNSLHLQEGGDRIEEKPHDFPGWVVPVDSPRQVQRPSQERQQGRHPSGSRSPHSEVPTGEGTLQGFLENLLPKRKLHP
ncbi:centromere protein S isoform X3 [Canis lupus familiaris]|uniref:centromere protein S isoform X3 n=1 Tax=Canis lupus familiaris TaxID=9615 RepID=UPI0018F7D486|nr:centromere protein S isoform X3 [Canis lupus familiaris]